MVVDDRVRVVVADPRFGAHPLAGALRAITGDAVSGAQEARVAGDVHVQQVAGTGPLVAVGWLLGSSRRPRDPSPLEHLPDGRVCEAGRAGKPAAVPSPSCDGSYRSPPRAPARAAAA